jgi:TolB protein
MMQSIRFWAGFALFCTLCGCTSLTIESEPPGAEVLVNNRSFGKTPATFTVSQAYSLRVEKEGYLPYMGKIDTSTPSPLKVVLKEDHSNKSAFSMIKITAEDGSVSSRRVTVHAEKEVIERSPNVKKVRKVTSLQDTWLNSFTISPDGEIILLSQVQETKERGVVKRSSNIWSIKAKTPGPLRRITQGNNDDITPAFSPDGKDVYFSSNRMNSLDIWKLNFLKESGLALQTSSSSMSERNPQISPNGQKMVFSAFMRNTAIEQIWLQDLGNNQLYQLREGTNPRWHPDGTKILFSAQERSSGEWKIWSMNADGSSPTQLSGGEGNNQDASYSPDGKYIVYASDRAIVNDINNYDIWIMTADGNNPIQLTTNGSVDDSPTFGPDGKEIYFRSNRGWEWNIWAIEIK